MECLDFPLIIQQDTAPVELVVNVTADPCPQVNWYINNTLITGGTSGIEVMVNVRVVNINWYALHVSFVFCLILLSLSLSLTHTHTHTHKHTCSHS